MECFRFCYGCCCYHRCRAAVGVGCGDGGASRIGGDGCDDGCCGCATRIAIIHVASALNEYEKEGFLSRHAMGCFSSAFCAICSHCPAIPSVITKNLDNIIESISQLGSLVVLFALHLSQSDLTSSGLPLLKPKPKPKPLPLPTLPRLILRLIVHRQEVTFL